MEWGSPSLAGPCWTTRISNPSKAQQSLSPSLSAEVALTPFLQSLLLVSVTLLHWSIFLFVCEPQSWLFCPHFAEVKNQTTCTECIESTYSLWRAQYMVCKKFFKKSYFASHLHISIKLEVISENTHGTHKKPFAKSAKIPRKKKRKLKGRQVTNPFWSCQVVTWGMFSQEKQKSGSFPNEKQHSDLNKEG